MNWSCIGHTEQKAYLEKVLLAPSLNERHPQAAHESVAAYGRFSAGPHALLLAGPEGIGKRMLAEDVMSELIGTGPTLDVMRLAPERDKDGDLHDIPIEAVRDMKQWLALRPVGSHKLVLVDDADRLGGEAANTLLKVLEEPPAYAHFFLVSGRPQSLLSTILSRCERLDFRPLSDAEMDSVLARYKLPATNYALLSSVAAGRPGLALRLLDGKKLPTVAKHIAGLEKALKAGVAERLVYAKEVADSDDAADITAWWLAWTNSQLRIRPELASAAHGLIYLNSALAEPAFNRRLALENFLLSC